MHKDEFVHHTSRLRLMHENVALIKELNELRRELRSMKLMSQKGGSSKPDKGDAVDESRLENKLQLMLIDKMKDIEKLMDQVKQLKCELDVKQERIEYLEYLIAEGERVNRRPGSREELPPMDSPEDSNNGKNSAKLAILLEDDIKTFRSDITSEPQTHRSGFTRSETSSEDNFEASKLKTENINVDVKTLVDSMVDTVEAIKPK